MSCQAAGCGDGFVQDGVEECDDGNEVSGDGCGAGCAEEAVIAPPDGGVVDRDGGTVTPPADAGADAGTTPDIAGGCGCTAPGGGRSPWALGLLLGLALIAMRRRGR